MNLEIERKFLVKNDTFKLVSQSKKQIKQGFLNSSKDRVVRVRTIGEKGVLTIKGPSKDGMSRFEWEKEISKEDATELFMLCEPGIIDKTRYFHQLDENITVEIDEFYGENKGLVLAEVELIDKNQTFNSPDYLGEEVTGNKKYYNAYLSNHPFKLWHKKTSN